MERKLTLKIVEQFSVSDNFFMQVAINLALSAKEKGEVPVGAIVVLEDQIIGKGFNQVITTSDPTAHAEVIALREAASHANNYRLPDCQLYVTLEPCLMCLGAIFHARLSRVVFGAWDPKTGACGSVMDGPSITQLNHHTEVVGGLMASECGQLLSDFFARRRRKSKEK